MCSQGLIELSTMSNGSTVSARRSYEELKWKEGINNSVNYLKSKLHYISTGNDGRLIICKKPSVTGRHYGPVLVIRVCVCFLTYRYGPLNKRKEKTHGSGRMSTHSLLSSDSDLSSSSTSLTAAGIDKRRYNWRNSISMSRLVRKKLCPVPY